MKEFFDSIQTREITDEDIDLVKYGIIIWLNSHIDFKPKTPEDEKYIKFFKHLVKKATSTKEDVIEAIAERALVCGIVEKVAFEQPEKEPSIH